MSVAYSAVIGMILTDTVHAPVRRPSSRMPRAAPDLLPGTPKGQEAFARGAAPNETAKRLHQIDTLCSFSRSTEAGTS